MARKVEVTLIDDIDGTPASRTFEFAVDGVNYEIDLNDSNVDKFSAAVKDFVQNARRVSGRKRAGRGAGSQRTSSLVEGAKPQDVRRWAAEQGIEVSERGRIPREVMEAYSAAH
jgi:hypothetical protein